MSLRCAAFEQAGLFNLERGPGWAHWTAKCRFAAWTEGLHQRAKWANMFAVLRRAQSPCESPAVPS